MTMAHFVIDNLIYSDDLEPNSSLRLYIYAINCRGYEFSSYFRKLPQYPDEEITAAEAKLRTEDAISRGCEVRITNGSDFLVLHFDRDNLVYPSSAPEFWEKVLA